MTALNEFFRPLLDKGLNWGRGSVHPIQVDGFNRNEALILGQRVRRPDRICPKDWVEFWDGRLKLNLNINRWRCEVWSGVIVNRPYHILVYDWERFWERRALNDLSVPIAF